MKLYLSFNVCFTTSFTLRWALTFRDWAKVDKSLQGLHRDDFTLCSLKSPVPSAWTGLLFINTSFQCDLLGVSYATRDPS